MPIFTRNVPRGTVAMSLPGVAVVWAFVASVSAFVAFVVNAALEEDREIDRQVRQTWPLQPRS